MTYLAYLRKIAVALAGWPCTTCGGGGWNNIAGRTCNICRGTGTVSTPGA